MGLKCQCSKHHTSPKSVNENFAVFYDFHEIRKNSVCDLYGKVYYAIVSFVKISAVNAMLYLMTPKNFCPLFLYFSSNMDKIRYRIRHKNLLSDYDFHGNRGRENHILLTSVSEILPVISAFIVVCGRNSV
jgi:hypothetical protein